MQQEDRVFAQRTLSPSRDDPLSDSRDDPNSAMSTQEQVNERDVTEHVCDDTQNVRSSESFGQYEEDEVRQIKPKTY
eukprot:scaffold7411_cov156-Skeletonema_menzelii.AAC.4